MELKKSALMRVCFAFGICLFVLLACDIRSPVQGLFIIPLCIMPGCIERKWEKCKSDMSVLFFSSTTRQS